MAIVWQAPEPFKGERQAKLQLQWGIPFSTPIPRRARRCGLLPSDPVLGRGPGAGDEVSVRLWARGQDSFHQPVEEDLAVAGVAAVEAEGELVHVAVELRSGDGALAGGQQPALEQ